ncbi:MAG: hypothetical protein M1816_007746 [Peltula sp. TS41687]|nr:MAG: hypothetical protein M1816_007746 [Peltula sp. TS41687]
MSFDAGGLAQMTYSNLPSAGTLAVPGSGYASKGKGNHLKQLSMPGPAMASQVFSPTGNGVPNPITPAPRTSRSHLLAGLRTAPRTSSGPPSAPPTQLHHLDGLNGSRHVTGERELVFPKTAIGSTFPLQVSTSRPVNPMNASRQMYSLPEQVLAPPAINFGFAQGEQHMDPNLYAELYATNMYLAQQQQRLQQQLLEVTAAAQQFQGLSTSDQDIYAGEESQQFVSPISQGMAFRNVDVQGGIPQMLSPVGGGSPAGVFPLYNLGNGQQGYVVDSNVSDVQYQHSPPNSDVETTSPVPSTPQFRAQVSPPPIGNLNYAVPQRNASPPKTILSPAQASPSLPPPSANAFRRGHKKATSLASCVNGNSIPNGKEISSPAFPKSAGFPQTPLTGTFGPGQGRAGEHPVRQPRGPPPLEELIANPTSKHDGSKNFATRQRRRAVHSLVRAGRERRSARGGMSSGSVGSMTPASETEITFSVSSDNESDSLGSGSLSRKPSLGSLRAAANGAIGSERKEMKVRPHDRDSVDGTYSAKSLSSDDGLSVGGQLVEIKAEGVDGRKLDERRKAPMLALSSAAKRKSSMF